MRIEFILIFLFAIRVGCSESLTGAFGYEIGAAYLADSDDIALSPSVMLPEHMPKIYDTGLIAYKADPMVDNHTFEEVILFVTPKSRRIAVIVGHSQSADPAMLRDLSEGLVLTLIDRYGPDQVSGRAAGAIHSVCIGDKEDAYVVCGGAYKDRRIIYQENSAESSTGLYAAYGSRALIELAEEERGQLNKGLIDAGGL